MADDESETYKLWRVRKTVMQVGILKFIQELLQKKLNFKKKFFK